VRDLATSVVGWAWRLFVGAKLCFNAYVLSYFTSVAVVGWTYRWMQALVLRGWWKQSRFCNEGTFADFCASLGPNAPVPRPRWFLQERIGTALARPVPGGARPGPLRLGLRLLRVPWHSFWLNLKFGALGLLCTYLMTGWGCLLIWTSWRYGWLNSFHKGYEEAWFGPALGITGSLLFILALFYVPMAQAHQAATGQARAFFEFRFVWRLIQSRLTAYVGLAALIAVASLVMEGLRLAVFTELFGGNNELLSDAECLAFYQDYLTVCSFVLFALLLLLRWAGAVIYRSAVLKALRRGRVVRGELNPVLAGWLDRLDLMPTPVAETIGLGAAARSTGRLGYRLLLYSLLFLVWVAFVVKFYVGYFIVADEVLFFNHVFIQLPCCDYIPAHLQAAGGG
jgi:hypothetical protein